MEQEDLNIDSIKKERLEDSPFKIPEDYFEKFADKLEREIQERETPLWDKVRSSVFTGMGLAAAMIIMFFVIQQTMSFLEIEKPSKLTLTAEQQLTLDLELFNIDESIIINDLFAADKQAISHNDLIEYLSLEQIEISEIADHL